MPNTVYTAHGRFFSHDGGTPNRHTSRKVYVARGRFFNCYGGTPKPAIEESVYKPRIFFRLKPPGLKATAPIRIVLLLL